MPRPRRSSARSSRRTPSTRPTLNYLGYTLVERGGRLDEAVALIKRAVALDPLQRRVSRQPRLGVPQARTSSTWPRPNLPRGRRATAAGFRRPGSLGRPAREARPARRGRRGVAPRAGRRRRPDRSRDDRAQDPRRHRTSSASADRMTLRRGLLPSCSRLAAGRLRDRRRPSVCPTVRGRRTRWRRGLRSRPSAGCRGVRTLTAEIAVRGRAGRPGSAGACWPGSSAAAPLRLEAPAPFGAPIFILVSRANRATLWLPRDRRVLRDAPVEDVLDAITGLRRSSDDLLALVSGCLSADITAGGPRPGRPGRLDDGGSRRRPARRSSRETARRGALPPGTATPARAARLVRVLRRLRVGVPRRSSRSGRSRPAEAPPRRR